MSAQTNIAWTDKTWNCWQGCHKVSAGCKNCYMYTEKTRYGQDPATVIRSKDATFYAPLKWEKQAVAQGEQYRVFTCSWSDFFLEEADLWRDEAFAIMALTPHLTYQVLSKRPERMLAYLQDAATPARILSACMALLRLRGERRHLTSHDTGSLIHNPGFNTFSMPWPLPSVWCGTSVEHQEAADTRIPILLQVPAALRFLSVEPLLAPVNLERFLGPVPEDQEGAPYPGHIAWVIGGGESGEKARPCQMDWLQAIVQQCRDAKTAVFVKQLGKYAYDSHIIQDLNRNIMVQCQGCMQCRYLTKDPKGADPAEWPAALRVQEFPSFTH